MTGRLLRLGSCRSENAERLVLWSKNVEHAMASDTNVVVPSMQVNDEGEMS